MKFSSRVISVTKNVFRQITPPIILKNLPLFKKSLETDLITYEGVFESFEAVIKSYGYQPQYSTELARTQSIQNLRLLISLYNSNINFTPSWSSIRFNFISSFVSSLECNGIGILDIGGGYGETYLHLKQSTKKTFEYRVFELPFTINESKSEFLNFKEIKFSDSLEALDIMPHIIYFGSSLQYFNDYTKILIDIMNFQAPFIIISDTPMGNIDTFACAQVNMPGIVIPRWVFNHNEICLLLHSGGYELIHDSSNYYPFHNFNNYASDYQHITHKNKIFRKKNQT